MHIIFNTSRACLLVLLFAGANSLHGQQTRSGLALDKAASSAPVARGSLKVFSEPAGAEILLNTKAMGITPLKIINIDAGEYKLSLRLQGFTPYETSIKILANETQNLSLALKAVEQPLPPPAPVFATITVATTPTGAALSINDQPVGTTPFRCDTMAPGPYKLRLELEGYDPLEGAVMLKAGETRPVEKKMIRQYGTLAVATTPPGAALSLNDQPSGTTPYKNEKLLPGNYALLLELPGYTNIYESIVMFKDTAISRQFALSHSAAWQDSVKAFALAKSKHGRVVRRVWFACLAAAAAGTGYYFDTQVAAAADRQDQIQTDYRAATTDFSTYQERYSNAGKKVKDNSKVRNILYSVAGAFALCFVISIPF